MHIMLYKVKGMTLVSDRTTHMAIIIYTKTGCPWCKGVLDLLNEKGVAYEEREVRSNPTFMKELTEKSGQTKTPTLDIDGEILADTDREAVDQLMKSKGLI
jgi:glutaredoxin 3